jgi:hypothetical protein
MTWVMRQGIRVNRTATARLVRRPVDRALERAAVLFDALHAALRAGE